MVFDVKKFLPNSGSRCLTKYPQHTEKSSEQFSLESILDVIKMALNEACSLISSRI